MNILFLTLNTFETLDNHTIYSDLLMEFIKNGHKVYAISPIERKYKVGTHFTEEKRASILRVRIEDMHNVNLIKKGLSTITIGLLFKHAVNKYYKDVRFDLIMYSTPPITLTSAITYVKKRDGSKTYLLLKDIFPQNAVDIGLLNKNGIKGLIYKHFRRKEKELYKISDWIGCMSKANVDYVIKHNPEVSPKKIEICPNCIEIFDKSVEIEGKKSIREKYNIPLEKKVFVYGGNLGKPQGIDFMVECLRKCSDLNDVFFLIVGSGSEYNVVKEFISTEKPRNVMLMKNLPKEEYDILVGACDVGLIFLDHRFTIPNFPSRLLSYMQAKLPVIACTDPNTDVGKVIVEGGFGWWCESNDSGKFKTTVERAINADNLLLGTKAYEYLMNNYSVETGYNIIQKRLGI